MTTEQFKQEMHKPWMLADTLQVEIVSAEAAIYSGRAKMVVVTAEEGELGVLPGHTPLLTTVKPGHVRLIKSNGDEEDYYVSGGFFEVQPDTVTILADTVIRAADVDEERALAAKAKAEAVLKSKHYDDYTAALIELTKAMAQIRVAQTRRR